MSVYIAAVLLLLGLIVLGSAITCLLMMAELRLDAELTEQAIREYDEAKEVKE